MSSKYLLLIDKSVAKQLQKFPAKQYKQVLAKLLSLASIPKPQDCLEPVGEQREQIQIFRAGKRNDDEVYRNL